MKSLRKMLLCSLLVLITSCATKEHLAFQNQEFLKEVLLSQVPNSDYHGDWYLANSQEIKGKYTIDEFVPKGETVENWTRLFTYQNFARYYYSQSSPEIMMNSLKTLMEKRCPGIEWKIVQKSETDVLYEYRIVNCPGNPDQHEIARIIFGKWNIWRLAYTEKVATLPEETRTKWIKYLSEPKVFQK